MASNLFNSIGKVLYRRASMELNESTGNDDDFTLPALISNVLYASTYSLDQRVYIRSWCFFQ